MHPTWGQIIAQWVTVWTNTVWTNFKIHFLKKLFIVNFNTGISGGIYFVETNFKTPSLLYFRIYLNTHPIFKREWPCIWTYLNPVTYYALCQIILILTRWFLRRIWSLKISDVDEIPFSKTFQYFQLRNIIGLHLYFSNYVRAKSKKYISLYVSI